MIMIATAPNANAQSMARTRNTVRVRGVPEYPRDTIAWCTSSDSASDFPNRAPAVAETNVRPSFTSPWSFPIVRAFRAVYMSVTEFSSRNRYR